MTPLEIEILLHYYYSSHDFPNLTSAAQAEAIKNFVKAGILTGRHAVAPYYRPNHEALNMYVEALSKVPLPVQKWIIE